MAYGRLPKPGTDLGPCVKKCNHRDCKMSRDMAETKCEICGEKIGYETDFQRGVDGSLVHYLCNIEKIEK